jgi:hypothetical protein
MAYTGTEIFERSISIIDELSDDGSVTESDVSDYMNRAPSLLDMWQHEMIKSGDVFKTFEISCFRKKNLLGDLSQYGIIVENNGESQEYSASGVNCFYLEVDGDCTVEFTENGSPVVGTYIFNGGEATAFSGSFDITVPVGTTSFLPIRGILTTSGGKVTMTISGNYYFRHNNRALSPYKFATADKVPDFNPWVKVTMPADFKSKSQIIDEYPNWQYEEANHKWEGANELYIHFAYEGIVRIKYVPVPDKITDLSQTLEVDDVTATSGAYYLAEHFAMADQNDALAQRCRDKFRELKMESMIKQPLSPSEIIDVYS